MIRILRLLLGVAICPFHSRNDLFMENLVLRQQLLVLKRRNRRPKIAAIDKLFLIAARRFWSGGKKSLIFVSPETVVGWHRAGFRLYWSWLSRHRAQTGRKQIRILARHTSQLTPFSPIG